MEWMRRRLLLLALGFGVMMPGPSHASAQSAPHIVVVVAEGAGFPFEDPGFNRYPALRTLRLGSRAFDAVFTSDAAWAGVNEALLGGATARGTSGLVTALAAKRYVTSSVSASGTLDRGFNRALKGGIPETAARVLEALDTAGARPAFVFATMDLRNVPVAGPAPTVLAPPLTVPAIALFDRAPLDPVRFKVTPPPRELADRGGLAASRHAAFMAIDREIGAIQTGVLKRLLAAKTVIVLVSTGPAPRPERSAPPRPDLLFEDWLRGLVLIRTPTIAQPGVAAATLGRFEDVAATLAALGGAPLARGGALDLGPAIRDPKVLLRRSLLTNAARLAPKVGRSVRSQRFRFTQWPDGSEELFDEVADPHEWNNLARVPGMQGQRADLLRRLVVPPPPGKATPARPAAGRRLNVLMIIGDDLTAHYAQFGDVKTPNLDRLRARGRFYEKAYAPAPFCTPSRAAFLSGMSPARLELHRENAFPEIFTPQVPLMQEQFRANGYYTASVGKVWDSQPGEKRGWDLNVWLPDLPPGQVEKPARLIENMPVEGGPTDNADQVEGDGRRTRLAVQVLETKRDQPLFLALGLVRPHAAWVAPQKYFDMYPLEAIRFTKAPANDGIDIPGIAIRNRPQPLPGLMMAGREPAGLSDEEAMAKRGIAAYLACVSFMDAQLGLVLDAMDRQDLWKDTIVVLFGDNGHHFGDHGGLWRKNTLFEESLRVPMVITSPGQAQPGVSTTALADLIDIYPTLVDLTGIAKPGTLDGVSLVPTLKDPKASVQDTLIQYRPVEPPRQGYTLRTARHRYTLWPDGSEELYDLTADPAGRNDLANQPGHTATLRTLRTQIEALVK